MKQYRTMGFEDLTVDNLVLAYRNGVFPWPALEPESTEAQLLWFCPLERAILDFDDLHIPRSLRPLLSHPPYEFSTNTAFEQVIDSCQSQYRPGQDGTWITPEMREAYVELHHLKIAHSIEAWEPASAKNPRTLVGGLYGVFLDGAFAGESMFYHKPNASKLALLYAIRCLQKSGIDWIDIQVLTPHLKALGAKIIPRDQFLNRLQLTHSRFRNRPHPF